MRLMKRILSAAAVLALSASLLVGCSSGTASSVPVSASSAAESTVSSVEETASSAVDENEAAAAQLLNDLTGSYQELWPVILADEYQQTWLDDCTALVGEDNAEAAFEKLSSMVTSDVYGEDAVKAYANGGGAYFCGFTNSLATLTFDGETSTIPAPIRTAMCCSPIPITTLAWSLCMDCMSLKVMMPIPASSPTFSSRQTPVRKPTTLSFAMVRMQKL